MKSRMTLILVTLVILLGTMIWLVQDRRNSIALPAMATESAAMPRISPPIEPAKEPMTIPAIVAETPAHKSAPTVRIAPSGEVTYVARDGDTVSQLAVALLGSDSKEHRDLVIAANPSLQANPDRVLTGTTYIMAIPAVTELQVEKKAQVAAPVATDAAAAKETTANEQPALEGKPTEKPAAVASNPKMKYTAQTGDTVGVLASDLLGGNTKANRDSIIAENKSLQQDPNRLVAGKSYTIVAVNGLASDPASPQAKAPSSQPDADDIILHNGGRALRYTAQPGDTVSKLAEILLGSDTKANRDLIIKVNPSLKKDPDTLIAGQTYWISAPTAD